LDFNSIEVKSKITQIYLLSAFHFTLPIKFNLPRTKRNVLCDIISKERLKNNFRGIFRMNVIETQQTHLLTIIIWEKNG
jgi:hypothetical protein